MAGICILLAVVGTGGRMAQGQQPGKGYQPATDAFYQKHQINLTWIMIWNGSTEKWWQPDAYHGVKVRAGKHWGSVNWNNSTDRLAYLEAIHDAGINGVIIDLTNGLRWLKQAKAVLAFCASHDMKIALAIKPDQGSTFDKRCAFVWQHFAGPSASNHQAYLYKDGKPLLVLYTWKSRYEQDKLYRSVSRDRFSLGWASGENPAANKWGWQLQPDAGPQLSHEVMFITGSVKFGHKSPEQWRRSMAWLDYGFVCAHAQCPRFLVVGSFDDLSERNAWITAKTGDAAPCYQARDRSGSLVPTDYYDRVSQWLHNGTAPVVPGGLIRDGAYVMLGENGSSITATAAEKVPAQPELVSAGKQTRNDLKQLVWFYHLGNNVYRLIELHTGLAFEAKGEKVILDWSNTAPSQRWQLVTWPGGLGYRLVNQADGEALSIAGNNLVMREAKAGDLHERWQMMARAVIPAGRQPKGNGIAVHKAGLK